LVLQGKGGEGSWLCSAPWLLDFGWEVEERGAGAAVMAVEESKGGGELDCHRRRWYG